MTSMAEAARGAAGPDFEAGASLGHPISLNPSPIPTPVQLTLPGGSATGEGNLVVRPTAAHSQESEVQEIPTPALDLSPISNPSATDSPILPESQTSSTASDEAVGEAEPTPGRGTEEAGPASIIVESSDAVTLVLESNPPATSAALFVLDSTPTVPPKATATATPAPSLTPAPQPTATPAPVPAATPAPTPTLLPTPTPSPQPTATPQPTPTPRPTSGPTATARPTATPTSTPYPTNTGLVIECIFYDGMVPRSEADEYVQIVNDGSAAVDLKGWKLKDLGNRGPEFNFESAYSLKVGEQIRVYTNQIHPRWGSFSFNRKSAIWINDRG